MKLEKELGICYVVFYWVFKGFLGFVECKGKVCRRFRGEGDIIRLSFYS